MRTLFWTVERADGHGRCCGRYARLRCDCLPTESSIRAASRVAEHDSIWLTRGNSIDRQPAFSPDDNSVVFASNRSRNLDLWVLSRKDGSLKRLTDDAPSDWDPAFTPDGKNILWSSNRSGNFEIWMAAADGSGAHQVSHDGVDAENPMMTPDGQVGVALVVESGETRDLEGTPGRHGRHDCCSRVSTTHRKFLPTACTSPRRSRPLGSAGAYSVFRVDNGAPVPFTSSWNATARPTRTMGALRWMPDGKALAFAAAGADGVSGIFVQDFVVGQDTSATRRKLAGFTTDFRAESFGFAPDGSVIVISAALNSSDVLLAHGIPNLLPPARGKR